MVDSWQLRNGFADLEYHQSVLSPTLLFDKQNPKTVKPGKTRKHTGNAQEKAFVKRIFKDYSDKLWSWLID